jgi:predicted nucleic acid-binding protein
MAAGVIETLILVDPVRSGYSFSGGAFFYIFAGLALRLGGQKIYRRISGAATIFLSLIVGGVAILLIDIIFFFSVRQIDTSFDPEDPFLLLVLAYAAVLPWLVYNLYHPNTRVCFDLSTTNGSPRTLFLSRVRFILVVVGALALLGLLGGPHLIQNPFTAIACALTQSGDISSRLGKPKLIADTIYFNPVVLGELKAGFARGRKKKENEELLSQFLESPRVYSVPIDEETSERYAVICNALWKSGTPIPSNDMWISASAMQHGLIVVTTDPYYTKVKQILVEYLPAE